MIDGVAHQVADRPRQGGRASAAFKPIRIALKADLVTARDCQRREVGHHGTGDADEIDRFVKIDRLVVSLEIEELLGRLGQPRHVVEHPPPLPAVGLIYIGLGTIWVDQGHYDQAALYLQRGEVLAKACFELSELVNGWRAQVKLHLALANPDQAIRVLDGAEAWLSQIVVPHFMRQHALSMLHTLRASATQPPAPLSRPAATPSPQELIEPLSERELEVLGLVSQGLSNSDIAHKLIITVGTVKKHLNNIFGKLQVSSRTQAIGRGRELGLLRP